MKKLILLVICIVNINCAFSQENILSKKITISFENESLLKALNKLKDEHSIDIAFNSKQNQLTSQITKYFTNQSVESILKSLFTNTDLSFKLIDNQIVIFEKKSKI